MLEATKITLNVTLEAFLLTLIVFFYLKEIGKKELSHFFAIGSLFGFIGGFVLNFSSLGERADIKFLINKGHLILSGGFILLALLSLPGREPHVVIGLEKILKGKKVWLIFLSFLWGLMLLPLESLHLGQDIEAIVFLKERNLPYFFSFLGLALGLALGSGLFYFFRMVRIGRFFTFPSLLFLIIAIKALWEPMIVTSIEVIVARILHDFVHWIIVFLLLPDHVYLTKFFWNLIAFFFQKNTSLIMNLTFIFSLGIFFLVYLQRQPFPELKGVNRGAERRKIWAEIRKTRHWQMLSILAACLILLLVGYNAYEKGEGLYQPTPQPLSVDSQGFSEVPLSEVSSGLMNVYSFNYEDKSIRFIIIKKPDGSFAVTLDCCLICPPTNPTSYAQMGKDLFCLYCGTPIPISTVGKPGGCNPIPIPFQLIDDSKLRFNARQAIGTWERANKGK